MTRDFESRFFNTGRFEGWFRRKFPGRVPRIVAKLVIIAVVFAAYGYACGFVVNKASAATATPPGAPPAATAPTTAMRSCAPDVSIPCSIRVNVRHFRQHQLGHSHGYRSKVDLVYRHPAAARRVWIRKIARAIQRQNHRLAVNGLAARYTTEDASWLYRQNVRDASCTSAGNYPAIASGRTTCRGDRVETLHNGPGLTKRQVQIAGTVILCGAGVALGVLAAGATAGMSTVLVAGTGAASCMWGLWASVDPG
jgi:hypothetical protein